MKRALSWRALLVFAALAGSRAARADEVAAPPSASPGGVLAVAATPPPPAIVPEADPGGSAAPVPPPRLATGPAYSRIGSTLLPLERGQHFTIDPVSDGVLIAGGGALAGLLSLILSTGEIKPTLPGPTSSLLSFDRLAVTQHVDPNAGTYSSIGLYATIGFAALDPFLSAYRDGWDAALVDAVMYAETISLTEALTDVTKIAVRRPRPIDYVTCPYGAASTLTSPACTGNTDLQLSFFSGHASTIAAIGATATYLAFQRAGAKSPRGWITLAATVGMTTFVSIERVRAGEHFPTDVLAGAFAGGMVGVLVPHLHKHAEEAPTVWIGMAPRDGGGLLTVSGLF